MHLKVLHAHDSANVCFGMTCERSRVCGSPRARLRTALLWYLANCIGAFILLEQPDHRSVGLFRNIRFQRLAEQFQVSLHMYSAQDCSNKLGTTFSSCARFLLVLFCALSLSAAQCYKIFVDMAAFGKFSLKPTVLWSNHALWLRMLSLDFAAADHERLRLHKVETAKRVWDLWLQILAVHAIL